MLACDIDPKVQEIYKMNFNMDVFNDVRKINKKVLKSEVEFVFAGSPC